MKLTVKTTTSVQGWKGEDGRIRQRNKYFAVLCPDIEVESQKDPRIVELGSYKVPCREGNCEPAGALTDDLQAIA